MLSTAVCRGDRKMVLAALSANRRTFQLLTVLLTITMLSWSLAGCAGVVSPSNGQTTPNTPATALAILSVQASAATTSSVQMSWATNIPATSAVDYGTTASYGASTPVDPTMVTAHQMALTNLAAATTYHYRVRSAAGSATATSNDQTFSTASATNTTPPSVAITSPAAGATLSGNVNLTAAASDSVGVASLQFKVDGGNVGASLTAAPYAYTLNTTAISNGIHVISATATDTAGNSATSPNVAVTVNNAVKDTTPPTVSIRPLSQWHGLPSPGSSRCRDRIRQRQLRERAVSVGRRNRQLAETPSHTGFTSSPASLPATIAPATPPA